MVVVGAETEQKHRDGQGRNGVAHAVTQALESRTTQGFGGHHDGKGGGKGQADLSDYRWL